MYEFDDKSFKRKLKKLRTTSNNGKKYSQNQLASKLNINRTLISFWEKENSDTLPSLENTINLCNLYNCTLDYIVGQDEIKNFNDHTISQILHLSENNIRVLQNNPYYSFIIDELLSHELFPEISYLIKQTTNYGTLKSLISTSFTPLFSNKIERLYREFAENTFPLEHKQEHYVSFLKNKIPFKYDFNPKNFIKNNFLEDGIIFVQNRIDDQFISSNKEIYRVIIECIADISFDYYHGLLLLEISKQRLNKMFNSIFDDIISTNINVTENELK